MTLELSARRFPRVITYPYLFVVLVGGIYGGIKLGSHEFTARIALASQYNTPVENWTLFLLGLGIAGLMLFQHLYSYRTTRVPIASVFIAVTQLVALVLFGAWGLAGIAAICILVYAGYYIRWRWQIRRSRVSGK